MQRDVGDVGGPDLIHSRDQPEVQQAANQLGGNNLSGAGEEGWGESLKVLGGSGGYGSGFGDGW